MRIKHFYLYALVLSIGLNVFFLFRKTGRLNEKKEKLKLYHYQNIEHHEGYAFFLDQIKNNYPETNINQKHFIVYRWDSLTYDFIYKDQMKVLDSMAANYGKYSLEYVFVTEMEKHASEAFLKRNHDSYKNVKMLYDMDDFISGVHNIKNIRLKKPMVFGTPVLGDKADDKQRTLYLIMDPKGNILHTNGNIYMVLKDSSFFKKLDHLVSNEPVKILN